MLRGDRIKNDIETLATFTSTPGEGVTRLAFISEEMKAREYLIKEMASAGLEFEWEEFLSVAPVKIDKDIMEALQEAASGNVISTHVMPSGAGHDAMVMASITPVGMVFVPSRNGKSHSPEEWTDYGQIRKGAEVMLGAVLKLAG